MFLAHFILLGGILHFGTLLASALVPRVLDWRHDLAKLNPLTRQLVWVHGAFIVLIIIGFGAISVALPAELATGSPLARAVCGFIALFWLVRVALQYAFFSAKPHLGSRLLRFGYHGLTGVFLYHVAVYGTAALS